jgi:hypothetical protein
MALRRLATVIERSDWPFRLTRNCSACRFAVFGTARLRLLIPENSVHGPSIRSRASRWSDLNLFLQPYRTVVRSAGRTAPNSSSCEAVIKRASMSLEGLGCVKTRRRGEPIEWTFRQIAISTTSGHTAATPPSVTMNSRRRIMNCHATLHGSCPRNRGTIARFKNADMPAPTLSAIISGNSTALPAHSN